MPKVTVAHARLLTPQPPPAEPPTKRVHVARAQMVTPAGQRRVHVAQAALVTAGTPRRVHVAQAALRTPAGTALGPVFVRRGGQWSPVSVYVRRSGQWVKVT